MASTVQFAMVRPAQRDRKLVADLAAQRSGLSEPQVVRVAGLPPTNQAGLGSDEGQMVPVPAPAGLASTGDRCWSTTSGKPGGSEMGASVRCAALTLVLVGSSNRRSLASNACSTMRACSAVRLFLAVRRP